MKERDGVEDVLEEALGGGGGGGLLVVVMGWCPRGER